MVRDMSVRFQIQAEYELEKGCRCGSCYDLTGRWIVSDMEDKLADVFFDTEKDARNWVREYMDKRNYETHAKID
jgi:hypothetical protein